MNHKFLVFILCLFLSHIGELSAQTKEKTYCDSILQRGVNAVWVEKDYAAGLVDLEEVRILAERNNWQKELFLAINNLGVLYYSTFDYGEALDYYLDAYRIALKYLGKNEKMIVLNNIAVLYSKEENYTKAKDYFLQAYNLAREEKDWFRVGSYGINLGIVSNKINELGKAKEYLDEAEEYVSNYPERRFEIMTVRLENELLQKNYRKVIQTGEQLLSQLNGDQYLDNYNTSTLIIARAFFGLGDLVSATRYAQKALTKNPDLNHCAEVFDLLSEIKYREGSYRMALTYKDSILVMHDSLNKIRNGQLFENNKMRFELQNYQHELQLKETAITNRYRIFYASVAGVLGLLLFLAGWLYNRSVKMKQKEEIEAGRRKIMAMEQEKLQQEVELRNRQLAAKALSISNRDKVLEEFLASLAKHPLPSSDSEYSQLLQSLKKQINSDNEWNEFVSLFENVNHGFLAKLQQKHPALNSNDIRFLCYVYMNLSTKEIASIFNITAETCRKRKERIIKKMELGEGVDLYAYLFSL